MMSNIVTIECPECSGTWRTTKDNQQSRGFDYNCRSCREWLPHKSELETLTDKQRLERMERLLFERKNTVLIPTRFGVAQNPKG